jgi:hypothetical protein
VGGIAVIERIGTPAQVAMASASPARTRPDSGARDARGHRRGRRRVATRLGIRGAVEIGASLRPRTRRRHAHEVDPQADAGGQFVADQRLQLAEPHRTVGQARPQLVGGGDQLVVRVRATLQAQPPGASRLANGQGERPVVAGRDEVDRDAHEGALHHGPVVEGGVEIGAHESRESRPQGDVHGRRVLGLDAGDAFEDGRNREIDPLEQELASEQCSVQASSRQHPLGHRDTVRPDSTRGGKRPCRGRQR